MNRKYPSIEKLTRYLDGELSVQESNEIRSRFEQSDEGRKELDQLEIIWGLADRLTRMENINRQKARKKVDSRLTPSKDRWTIFRQSFQKAAAILIIPVLVFSGYLFLREGNGQFVEQEFVATYGTRSALLLPDGSKVWLNSGSKLKYGQDFNRDGRTVFLTGEAFFDVAANESKPFDVVTGMFTVRAVGTEFNVFSYEENEFETSLEEGQTEIFLSRTQNPDDLKLKMRPGQRVVFDQHEGRLVLSDVDVSQFSTWRDGKLSFRNTPVYEVIMKMERWFNVDIELKDPELLNYRYTAVFENETVLQALEMLSFSSPIKYKIAPGEKLQDGTHAKSKIEISIRN
ncbi:FecR family protein [Gaoshiqia sp. Z1-71]|uniref:FecR family protein n=1 Tax=Gaoshiqia hydrogeniformans TaxID=3290090 RepID=UPI003BF8996D